LTGLPPNRSPKSETFSTELMTEECNPVVPAHLHNLVTIHTYA
jgi:hypothetical protein